MQTLGKNFRFSVVIPKIVHDKLEEHVREVSFINRSNYSKSDFVRESIIDALSFVSVDKTPAGTAFTPKATEKKTEEITRFSVVIPNHYHDQLEDFVREYSYKNHVDYKKSDFVRESVLAKLAEVDAKKAKV